MKKIVLPLTKEEQQCYLVLIKLFGIAIVFSLILFLFGEWIP